MTPEEKDATTGFSIFERADQEILDENREIRRRIVKSLSTVENPLPSDKLDKQILLAAMKDIDKEIMDRAKVKIAAKAEKSISDAVTSTAAILLNYTAGSSRAQVDRVLDLPSEIVLKNDVPGLKDIGLRTLSVSELVVPDRVLDEENEDDQE